MAEHEAERDLLVEALVLLGRRQAELEQRIAALEAVTPGSSAEPSPALRGLVEDLRGNRLPSPAPETTTTAAPPESPRRALELLRPRHLDSALIVLGVLVLAYAGLYQLAQALGFA